jgi:anaerobic magnesium-protoporphyrin IX monomethyl ester cyclase
LVKVALIRPAPRSVVQEHDRPKYPCIGLACLSGFLKANGVDVLTVDAKFDGLSLEKLRDLVLGFQPDVLGFTAMTHEITCVAEVAGEFRKSFPDALMLIGGPHATMAATRTLQEFQMFDVAVIGEGELTLLELANLVDESIGEKLESVSGIAWRAGSETRMNKGRELISDLDSMPFPSYDHVRRKIDVYPVFSSRGCPNQCIFCCRVLGNRIRVRSPKNVVAEIEHALSKFGPRLVDFADETFTFPRKRAMEICELMISEGLHERVRWTAQSRVTGVDQELFTKMKEAGCVNVDFGVESGNPDVLKRIRKGITVDDAWNAVEAAKKAGLRTGSYFIIGHPFETAQTIRDTISFATRLNTDTVSFGIMVPYPGTEVYEMALKGEGGYRLISEEWADYDKQIGNALELDGLDRKELERWQRKAYTTFFVRNLRFLDMVRLAVSQRRLLWKMLSK